MEWSAASVVLEHWNIGLQNNWMVELSSVKSLECARLYVCECEREHVYAKSCTLHVYVLVCLLTQCQQHFQI